MTIFEIHETNPQERLITKAVDSMKKGGVIVYPTDTVYAFGCDIREKNAIERIYSIKKLPKNKPLSFIFSDISQLHEYVRNISDPAFKIMKRAMPGPYTFIFKASKLVPKVAITNQKTIGVRIPDNRVTLALVAELGRPILSASVSTDEGTYVIDPTNLEKRYRNEVDIIINCGPKLSEPSTI
ncbi:MAG TPA: L-threonylcarbamoyladenylate synthase, partial [Spirochaetota bacterium]|nr:L-threonylcarbamoyladenylate synthase [Spirochaetota bacterium]